MNLPNSGTKELGRPRESILSSWTTTLPLTLAGLVPLYELSRKIPESEVFLALLTSLESIEGTGTYSVSDGQSLYTISFFAVDSHIFLAILQEQEHGQQVLQESPVLMTEKFTFLKLAIWLSVLMSLMSAVALMSLILE